MENLGQKRRYFTLILLETVSSSVKKFVVRLDRVTDCHLMGYYQEKKEGSTRRMLDCKFRHTVKVKVTKRFDNRQTTNINNQINRNV